MVSNKSSRIATRLCATALLFMVATAGCNGDGASENSGREDAGATDAGGSDGGSSCDAGCPCTPAKCGPQNCGTTPDGCSGALDCGQCPAGTEFFVATTGNDADPGTAGRPWKTLYHAVESGLLGPGVHLWLRGGTYDHTGGESLAIEVAATADAPLVISNYPGEDAIVRGEPGPSEQRVIEIFKAAHVHLVSEGELPAPEETPRRFRIEGGFFPVAVEYSEGVKLLGIETTKADHTGISTVGTQATEVRGVYSHDNGDDTHEHGIYPSGWNTDMVIADSVFARNGGCGIHPNYGHATEAFLCDPSIPENNEDCLGWGTGAPGDCLPSGKCKCLKDYDCPGNRCDPATNTCVLVEGTGMVISGNIISDNRLCGVAVWDGNRGTIIENNLFVGNAGGGTGPDSGPAMGEAALLVGSDGDGGHPRGVIFRNNTIIGGGQQYAAAGFAIYESEGAEMYNNIVVGAENEWMAAIDLGAAKGMMVHHNLYWSASLDRSDMLFYDYGADVEMAFGDWQANGGDASSLWGDPLFVDAPSDLRVKPASPAVDSGASTGPAADFDGKLRPQGAGVDMGAYEQ